MKFLPNTTTKTTTTTTRTITTKIAVAVAVSLAISVLSSATVADAFVVPSLGTVTTIASSRSRSHSTYCSLLRRTPIAVGSKLFLREPAPTDQEQPALAATRDERQSRTDLETTDTDTITNANTNAKSESESQEAAKNKNESLRVIGPAIRKTLTVGSGLVFNLIGLYFGVGLLLNIFGYAYSFSMEDGYKVDTIQNRRIELQFERESQRYEMERASKVERAAATDIAIGAVARAETTSTSSSSTATSME